MKPTKTLLIILCFSICFGFCRQQLSKGASYDKTSPLMPLQQGLAKWGIDAPTDSDQVNFLASQGTFGGSNGTMGYREKVYLNKIRDLSELPTITVGGTVRFGPTVVDGLSVIEHTIKQGDALRWQGNRSGIVYDDFPIHHGHDYWFAWAFKLGLEWKVDSSGGHHDRASLLDTHQDRASVGNPSGLIWFGDSPAGHELWWYVERMDGVGSAFLYNAAAAPGKWQRVILHYRSGNMAQKPAYDVWFATGKGEYERLERAVDPDTKIKWLTVPAFGDSLTNKLQQNDYVKLEIYKWTTKYYGHMSSRTMWSSGLFGGEGIDLFRNAVLALKPFVR